MYHCTRDVDNCVRNEEGPGIASASTSGQQWISKDSLSMYVCIHYDDWYNDCIMSHDSLWRHIGFPVVSLGKKEKKRRGKEKK